MAEESSSRGVRMLPLLTISRAAVFAEPAVTNVEKVVCLIHRGTEVRSQESGVRSQESEIKGTGLAGLLTFDF